MSGGDCTYAPCGCVWWDEGRYDPCERHARRSVVKRIRAWLACVPLRITKQGVTRLDFDAHRRGERRTPDKRPSGDVGA